MKRIALCIVLLFPAALYAGTPGAIQENTWVTDDLVYAMQVSGDRVYLGGDFTLVGPYTGSGVPLDAATGKPPASFPQVNGRVAAVAPDGSGGWYIGGSFTKVGSTTRNRLAHILPDGSVDAAWNPEANNAVSALAVGAGTVYAGGSFTTIGGQTRNRIAALDAATGAVTAWDPGADFTVSALAVSGNTVYAAGSFYNIGGQARNRLAALDAATGAVAAWNPNANYSADCLAASGNTVYAGGYFTGVGCVTRNRLAAVDAATGSATDWDPGANDRVTDLEVSGKTVYVCGDFTTVGGQSRNRLAALDIASGAAAAWDPDVNDYVSGLAVAGNTVYVGGSFSAVGGQPHNYIAAVDAATGEADAWDPGADSVISCLAVHGSTVYAAGFFSNIGGQPRRYLAALDAVTGAASGWNPNPSSTVRDLAVSGDAVYAGGQFTSIGGQSRNRLAALDTVTGAATGWNPNANDQVFVLALNGDTVYAGGSFITVGGQPHKYIVALDAATGGARDWNPDPALNNNVYGLTALGGTVYASSLMSNAAPRYVHQWGPYFGLSVSGIAPSAVLLPAVSTVTVTGTAFAPGATVSIGGLPATNVTFVSPAALTCVTPAGVSLAGAKDVTVTNPDTRSATLAGGFTFLSNASTGTIGSAGGTVTILPESGEIRVDLPAGAFGSAVILAVSTAAVPASDQDTVKATNLGIEITNSAGLQPGRDITITVHYRDSDVAGLDESKLSLARYDNGRWVPIPTVVYADSNRLVGTIRHLSTFAVVQLAPSSDLAGVKAYPNPFDPKSGSLTIANLTAEAEIRIYTAAGELVRTLGYSSADGRAVWNGRNDAENDVASGVYLAVIKSPAGKRTIKIAVER